MFYPYFIFTSCHCINGRGRRVIRISAPDLVKKPWWNWYLNPCGKNFDEVRMAKLAKSTLLTTTLVPWDLFRSFKVCSDAEESGVRKAKGSYRTYSSLVKLQSGFLSLRWKNCLSAKLRPWFLSLQWRTCSWVEYSDDINGKCYLK